MPGTVDNKLIFHLGVLIPFWVLQMILEILVIAFNALAISSLLIATENPVCYTDDYGDEYCTSGFEDDSILDTGYGSFGAALGLGSVFLIMHIVQVALFGRKRLTPAANFGMDLSRFIAWTLVFIFTCVAAGLGIYDLFGIIFVCIAWALYMGSMIYASVIFHRSRRGRYNGTYNPGYPNAYPTQPMNYGPGPYQHPNQYQQQYQQQVPFEQQQMASPQPVHGQPVYAPAPAHLSPPQETKIVS